MPELPIACTLSAAELQERRGGLLPGLLARAVERRAIAGGYRWRFAPSATLLSQLAPVIEAERHCCRFLRFVVEAEPDGGPISLEVTGPPGTPEFLDQLTAGAAA